MVHYSLNRLIFIPLFKKSPTELLGFNVNGGGDKT